MKTYKLLCCVIAMVLFFFTQPAVAQDASGCKDHPFFTRMPNFSIQDCEMKNFTA